MLVKLFHFLWDTCLYGSMVADGSVSCKLFLFENDKRNPTLDVISCGFQCPMCDRHDKFNQCSNILSPNKQSSENCSEHYLDILVSLFPELLYDDSSEEARAVCIRVIPRILMHTAQDFLKTKHKFSKETDMASLLSMLPGVFALALLQDNKGQQG